MRWRTIDGEVVIEDTSALALQVLLRGLLTQNTLLQMICWFTVFEDDGKGLIKNTAGYHQFHAVRKGVAAVFAARGRDGRDGVIFATIQKFRPGKGDAGFGLLTNRDNVVVFADDAHRSQYGFEAKIDAATGQTRYGFAHHLRQALPNAVHVGFTGTPVSLVGADTQGVFGNCIDIYDVTRAVEDGATVPKSPAPRWTRNPSPP